MKTSISNNKWWHSDKTWCNRLDKKKNVEEVIRHDRLFIDSRIFTRIFMLNKKTFLIFLEMSTFLTPVNSSISFKPIIFGCIKTFQFSKFFQTMLRNQSVLISFQKYIDSVLAMDLDLFSPFVYVKSIKIPFILPSIGSMHELSES